MKNTNIKFDNLIAELYDIMRFCYDNCKSEYIMMLEKTIIILAKLKECDETSATKCFTTINEIKELMKKRL